MIKKEIFDILKEAANFKIEQCSFGPYGYGSIAHCPQCKDMNQFEYSLHYDIMKNLLESLPWEKVIKNPRLPEDNEYPKEDGIYITMMDCNEHEVCTNKFENGKFTWMNRTHIKWWMKLPEYMYKTE